MEIRQNKTVKATINCIPLLDEMLDLTKELVSLKAETINLARPVVIPPNLVGKVRPEHMITERPIRKLYPLIFSKRIEE